MAQKKRSLEAESTAELDDVHSSRNKRVKYTEEDAQLAEIHNNLADEVPSVRIQAATELLQFLSTKSSKQTENIEAAEARLIKGLCSGRKAARLGFSVALVELFRLKVNEQHKDGFTLSTTVDKIVNLTASHGNVSGQEQRDHALGRRFAFQALLQSDIGLSKLLSDEQWKYLVKSIFELASQKQWLRRECGNMLYEYLASPSATALEKSRVRAIVDELIDSKLAKTPEGVGIWITVQKHFPQVKLPKDIWRHKDPLASKELPVLSNVLLEANLYDGESRWQPGARQSQPGFAWNVVLSQLYDREDIDAFAKFWEAAVASTMFLQRKSSSERKALGLQVLTLAICTAPESMLHLVLGSTDIISCILDLRSSPMRLLFDAANVPLKQMAARGKAEPSAASTFVRVLIENGTPNFDQLTRSKTVETMISSANAETLEDIVTSISSAIEKPSVADQDGVESIRRMLADMLLTIVKTHSKTETFILEVPPHSGIYAPAPWACELLDSLVNFGYDQEDPHAMPAISETSRKMFRQRLMSCIGYCLDRSIDKAVIAPLYVVESLSRWSPFEQDLDERQQAALTLAIEMANGSGQQASTGDVKHAFELLFSLSAIQVYNGEADSPAVLEDLNFYYWSAESQDDSFTILVELLLSFISKPSALFRRMAEQVFAVFAPQLDSESMGSFIDILEQKESLSGQQTLFQEHAEDGQHLAGAAEEDDSVVDVEEESDVELVNGHEATTLDQNTDDDRSDSSESSSQAGEGASSEDQDDEVVAFDKKLAEALGTSGLADSDDDGSDMDDEQMMALEPHLTSIFQERQKTMPKKSEKKDAKENIINFKNRVLDLLTIYVKNQYSNELALDLILPLLTLIRTTTSKPTSEKASTVLKTYYEACNKNKKWPRPNSPHFCFAILDGAHVEMRLGGSKLHTSACSRASLFVSKVLVGLDPQHYEHIAKMYAELQSEWYLDPKSKVQGSVFTEWTSWSINTRKQM